MRSGSKVLTYVIGALIVIGILYRVNQFIIPIIVLGIIFLLYKFPPNRWMNTRRTRKTSSNRSYKKAKFRVIQGNKEDNDEPPKYH